MSGAETPHTVQYVQHCSWPVGLTDVPKDWLPVANARCLYHASPVGLVPQPSGYLVAITTSASPIEGILFGSVGFENKFKPETDRRADLCLKAPRLSEFLHALFLDWSKAVDSVSCDAIEKRFVSWEFPPL